MDIDYIVKTFLETLKGVPITLIIMVVAMVLSFFTGSIFGLRANLQDSRGEEFFLWSIWLLSERLLRFY